MSNFNRVSNSSIGKDLERVVEPLASYICATEQPKSALMSALAVLFREMEATNRAATTHFRTYSDKLTAIEYSGARPKNGL